VIEFGKTAENFQQIPETISLFRDPSTINWSKIVSPHNTRMSQRFPQWLVTNYRNSSPTGKFLPGPGGILDSILKTMPDLFLNEWGSVVVDRIPLFVLRVYFNIAEKPDFSLRAQYLAMRSGARYSFRGQFCVWLPDDVTAQVLRRGRGLCTSYG
jgi:hypothetical protein